MDVRVVASSDGLTWIEEVGQDGRVRRRMAFRPIELSQVRKSAEQGDEARLISCYVESSTSKGHAWLNFTQVEAKAIIAAFDRPCQSDAPSPLTTPPADLI